MDRNREMSEMDNGKKKKRIAFINQRYGLEVNGGSEYYTRLIAEKLAGIYEVEVLTSKALSYEKWADYYEKDVEYINDVLVRRFGVKKERNDLEMKFLTRAVTKLHMNTKKICDRWVKDQGPYVPELIAYIKENKNKYDVFIFVTYLYYPTVMGMREVREKSIFIPTAHDEPYIYFKSHQDLFTMPKGIIYLTEEEKLFVNQLFHNENIPSIVAGVGVELPPQVNNSRFRTKYDVHEDYLIYVGRVDKSKGCGEMFGYFMEYLAQKKDRNEYPNLTLIVMGQEFMNIPKHPQIRYLGFVSEEDKFDAISGAKALWLPSQFESLSISVLEAMSLSVPVLVNGKCEVLKGHCTKSDGGLYYEDYDSCEYAIDLLTKGVKRQVELGHNAYEYIQKNYLWSVILDKIKGMIESV